MSTKKRPIKIQTPGTEPTKEQMPPQAEEETLQAEEETLQAEEETLQAEEETLQAEEETLQAEEAPVVGVNKPKSVALPDQKDIDPDKIERSVLTKEGWVVPTNLGKAPRGF